MLSSLVLLLMIGSPPFRWCYQLSSLKLEKSIVLATRARFRSSIYQQASSVTDIQERKHAAQPRNPLILNIYVDKEILSYLEMKNFERKQRILLSRYTKEGDAVNYSVKNIRTIIENKLPSLIGQPYKLRYGTLVDSINTMKPHQKLKDSADESLFASLTASSSSIQLYVQCVPGLFPPPTETFYKDMEDPAETESFTMVSFYSFYPIDDPVEFSHQLERLWKPFLAVGRVYVATEGINAQMAIPTNVINNFQAATRSLEAFSNLKLNTDHLVTTTDFEANKPFKALHIRVREQIVSDGFTGNHQPFMNKTDEFQLDWTKSGKEMSPLEWHHQLDDPNVVVLDCRNSYESDVGIFNNAIPLNTTFFRESWTALDNILKDKPKDTKLMTYCTGGIRCVKINAYLEQKLGFSNVHRLQGGIISYARELEQSAYSTTETEQGDSKVIKLDNLESIDLLPSTKDSRNLIQSKFKGVNYVFDERIGSRITEDVLTSCEMCGKQCDSYANCQNAPCNVRFIQCKSCRSEYDSCCCKVCQSEHTQRLAMQLEERDLISARALLRQKRKQPPLTRANSAMLAKKVSPQTATISSMEKESPTKVDAKSVVDDTVNNAVNKRDHAVSEDALLDALSLYSEMQSFPEPKLLSRLREETKELFDPMAFRMVCGALQGRLLAQLTALVSAKKVLELGTFTGYSTLCFAEGVAATRDRLGGGESSEYQVLTCEIDDKAADFAQRHFASSPYGDLIHSKRMPAVDMLKELQEKGCKFEIVFIDAEKKKYLEYVKTIIGDNDGGCDEFIVVFIYSIHSFLEYGMWCDVM